MICDNILEAVGSTPLVRLRRMTGPDDAQVLVKFEAVNVGGSVKTRTALKMIERAEERGELSPDSIIVEPTQRQPGRGARARGGREGLRGPHHHAGLLLGGAPAHHGALRGRGDLRP